MSYKRFCEEMQISRSTSYDKSKGESQLNIDILRHMDEIYMDHPTAGVLSQWSIVSVRNLGHSEILFSIVVHIFAASLILNSMQIGFIRTSKGVHTMR